MFKIKNKLSSNLKDALNINLYKTYRVIIKCSALISKVEKRILSSKGTVLYCMEPFNCICACINKRIIERLIEYPEVSYVSFDNVIFSIPFNSKPIKELNNPTKKLFTSSNNKKEVTLNGKDISIALISTGIYPNNDLIKPDDRIIKSIDLINNYSYPYDDLGMGTCLAGIIGGNGYTSKGIVKGLAPRCNFYSIKAFDKTGKAFVGDLLYSLYLISKDYNEYNIKVIYLPLESFSYNKFLLDLCQTAFDYITDKKITIILPTGSNKNIKGSIKGISILNNCITVGGISSIYPPTLYEYSSCGPCLRRKKPDFIAECKNISTLNSNKDYIPERDGIKLYAPYLKNNYIKTSSIALAGAYIAGLCILLYEHRKDLNWKDIYSLLKLSCTKLELPKESIGHGIIRLNNLILPNNEKNK